ITNMPIIILRDKDGQRVLPIWVGVFEANAIALQIENVATPRPMTPDLLPNVIHDLKADILKIVVSDLKENTFYALIHLQVNGEPLAVDARPSDAIALALRARAPIYVEDKVIDNAKTIDFAPEKRVPERLQKRVSSRSRSGWRALIRRRWGSTKCRAVTKNAQKCQEYRHRQSRLRFQPTRRP